MDSSRCLGEQAQIALRPCLSCWLFVQLLCATMGQSGAGSCNVARKRDLRTNAAFAPAIMHYVEQELMIEGKWVGWIG